METVMRHAPGEAVKVDYVRYGSRRSATLRLTQMDVARTAARDAGKPGERSAADKVGFAAVQITPDIAAQLGNQNARGVVVAEVDPAGPVAGQIGRGFVIERVNGRAIGTIAELRGVVDALRPGQVVSMTGRHDDGTAAIVNFRARG
jgi:S1-C subfamily serine protease